MTKPYHYPLDGVRFASALAVGWFHLGFYSWASTYSSTAHIFQGAAAFPALTAWAWFGWVGVEVFFVISGFVIANSANDAAPIAFLKGRMLRLLPAAWICATITLLALLFVAHDDLRSLIRPYLHSMLLWVEAPWIDGVYWSLAVEIAFYSIILCLLLLRRFAILPYVAWALTFVSGVYLVLTAGRLVAPTGLWWTIMSHSELLLLRHGAFFAVGIWLWLFNQRLMTPVRWAGLAAALSVGCLEIWMRAESLKTEEASAALGQPSLTPVAIWLLAVIALLVFTRWPERFTPRSPLARARLKQAGQATYPFYLVHNILGAGALRLLLTQGAPPYLALAGALGFVVTVSFTIAQFGEPAARRAFKTLLDRIEGRLRRTTWLVGLSHSGGRIH